MHKIRLVLVLVFSLNFLVNINAAGDLALLIFENEIKVALEDAPPSAAKTAFLTAKEAIVSDAPAAIDDYHKIMQDNPTDAGFKAYFARLLYESGNIISATEYVNQVLTLNYDQAWFYIYFTAALMNQADISLADQIINQGISKWPTNEQMIWLYTLVTANSDPEKALNNFSKLKNITLKQYIFKHDLERILGRFDNAVNTLQLGLSFYPNSIELYQKLILDFLQLGNRVLALNTIETAKKKFLKSAELYNLEAFFYESAGDYESTLTAIKKAYSLEPDNLNYQSTLARVYWAVGDYDNSAKLMEKLVDQDITDLSLYQRLARYYQANNQPFTAEDLILNGLSLANNYLNVENSEIFNSLIYEYAIIQEAKGNHQSAILNLIDLLELNADNPNLHYSLARNYFSTGEYQQAIDHLEIVLESITASDQIRADFKEDLVLLYAESLIALNKFNAAIEFIDQNYPDSKAHRIVFVKARAYFYSENYAAAKNQIQYYITNFPDLDISQVKYLYATLYQLDFDHKNVIDILNSINQSGNVFKDRNLGIAKFRDDPSQGALILEEYFKYGHPDLTYIEIAAYLDNSYLDREWKDSKVTLQAFEAIILGLTYSELLAQVPKKWQEFLVVLADSFLIYPTLKTFNTSLETADNSWQAVYSYYAALKQPKAQRSNVAKELVRFLYQDPDNVWLNYIIASDYYLGDQQYFKALALIKKFLRKYPLNIAAKIELAICYDGLMIDKKAESYLLSVLNKDAQNYTAINNLAWLYLTSDDAHLLDPKKALVMAQKAAAAVNSSAFWDTLAEAYFQNGEYEKAAEAIQKALVLDASKSDHFKNQLNKINKIRKKSITAEANALQ